LGFFLGAAIADVITFSAGFAAFVTFAATAVAEKAGLAFSGRFARTIA
jgi:hypothetical protein